MSYAQDEYKKLHESNIWTGYFNEEQASLIRTRAKFRGGDNSPVLPQAAIFWKATIISQKYDSKMFDDFFFAYTEILVLLLK